MHASFAVFLGFSGATGCVPRARMCHEASDCVSQTVCVAGRCHSVKANVRAAIEASQRLVFRPVDIGYVSPEEGTPEGSLPSVAPFGSGGEKLFLRFDVALPAGLTIVEAYVVLHQASSSRDDSGQVALHAARIVGSWSGHTVSWRRQPRLFETKAPSTTRSGRDGPLVRIDVTELVERWTRRDALEQGIAVLAESSSKRGITVALDERDGDPEGRDTAPFLEVYAR